MATPIITHAKVSGKAAGTDSTRVYGTHWDEDHVVTGLENVDNTSDAAKNAATATLTNKTIDLASNTLTGTKAQFNTALSDGDFATLAGSEALTNKTYNGNTFTAGTGTLTIGASKTATFSATTTFAGVDSKTLTINNSLTLAGTDGTVQTFPSTSGTVVSSVSTNVVTNAMAAQMAAYTLKGNSTGSTAAPTDVDLAALTTKATPGASDYILISDQSASGALKKATVSSVGSSSGVSSIAGNSGAFTLGIGLTNSTNVIQLSSDFVGEIKWIAASRAPTNTLLADGAAVSRATYATLLSKLIYSSTATITIASPAVVTWNAHGLRAGDPVKFYTSGSLPTGVTAGTPGTGGTIYYVQSTGLTANTFRISATCRGSDVNTSGSQSGTHTVVNAPWGDGDNSTTFNLPNLLGQFARGYDTGNTVDVSRAFGSAQLDAFQGHKHGFTGTGTFGTVNNSVQGVGTAGNLGNSSTSPPTGTVDNPTTDGVNGTPRTASETRPTNATLLPVIRYQ